VRDKGFTIIELMVAIAVLGIIAAFAIPAASDYIDHRKIINAAEAVYGQLQYGRSQAIARSEKVYSRFGYDDNADPTTWIMGVSTEQNCDLAGSLDVIDGTVAPTLPDAADDCILVVDDGDGVVHGQDGNSDVDDLTYHVLSGEKFNGVSLDADGDPSTDGAPLQISFNPTRGTVTSETVFLTYGDPIRYEMRVVSYISGRIYICTPDGAKQVPGYTECPNP
jgi:type IV fimbrial biogenesis protein FimT